MASGVYDDYPEIPGAPDAPKTLRDEFAMACMSGLLAAQNEFMGTFDHDFEAAADAAYGFATAMMKRRTRP